MTTAAEETVPELTPDLLRSLFLFEALDDDQIDWLMRAGHLERFPAGPVYQHGEPATCFYVLVEGSLVLSARVGADDVDLSRTDQPGVYAGAFQAYLGERAAQTYSNSMRITTPSTFFVLDADVLAEMMRAWFPMAVHMLEGLFLGMRRNLQEVGQRERLLALGSLSAGLTHELNNPASAAVRATGALRERVAGMRHKLEFIASGGYQRDDLAALIELQERAAEQVAKAPVLTPLEVGDREDILTDWLDAHDIYRAWELAPTLVQAGFDEEWLERVLATVGEANLNSAMHWLGYTVETELLMNEIQDSTARISALVDAAKQYSQLDRAPYQTVDVHALLDSTVVMLAGKLHGIDVVKDYEPSLPSIQAYPAELNQVWTNLIDNAVAAMDGTGTLTLRTRAEDGRVAVEIGDTGPGVPAEIRERIFEPFFTTKAVGKGTGLGLDISYRIVVTRHGGDLRVESTPGDTRFTVTLPLRAAEVASSPGASTEEPKP
ncbi:MAG: ATP-binding protein [bacterium]